MWWLAVLAVGGSRSWVGIIAPLLPQRRSSDHPRFVGSGRRNTIWSCFTTAGQCSHYWIVRFLLTWIECPFSSVVVLCLLGIGLNFLTQADTNWFLQNTKYRSRLTIAKPP
jgi:hypothetical protein